jgi:prevent-host-death family protein
VSEGANRARVGVRELRQNLSVYLRRVEQGESLDVTEHGRVVASLGPAPAPAESALERMVAEGRATAPTANLSGLRAPIRARVKASKALRELRSEER